MRGYIAFTKKEFLEQLRTYKLLIVFSVLFLFGMMSPLLARLMPEIFSSMDIEGMKITMPEPTIMDAYGQFFKNVNQMGILVILLVFGGTLSNELMRGTLIHILSKGLPRRSVILSKYTAAVILWTAAYAVSAATAYGYTEYLFHSAAADNLLFSLFCLWLFGCFILAMIFLSSTIANGSFGGLILSVAVLAVLLLLNIFPKAERFNPITLASVNTELLMGTKLVSDLIMTVWLTVVLTVVCLILSVLLFGKKRL